MRSPEPAQQAQGDLSKKAARGAEVEAIQPHLTTASFAGDKPVPGALQLLELIP